MIRYYILLGLLFAAFLGTAQTTSLEGYVFESNNRGYLNLVKIEIKEKAGPFSKTLVSNKEGYFTCDLPVGKEFNIAASKDVFEFKEVEISTVNATDKVFTKIEMIREPGFLFEVTMAEKFVEGKEEIDAITDALIEIYNNTADTSVLVLSKHPSHTFNYTFEQGNHYTVMLRKEGYFTKRLEAFVNVDGCIMCFEGIEEVTPGTPGIADNLTAGHVMGTLVANVELEEIRVGEAIKVENIYYDLAKSDIRDDATNALDNLIHVLKNNPSLMVELGSHTDSQGDDESNYTLSSQRAQSAVEYILANSNIRKGRIQARGYGESDLVNGCKNGVKCSDRKHQQNRRTELKILGITEYDPFSDKTLAQIIHDEKFEETLATIQDQGEVQFAPGEVPDEILAQAGGKKTPTSATSEPSQPVTSQPSVVANNSTSALQGNHSTASVPDNPRVVEVAPTDLVGENEPEIDLNNVTDMPSSNTGEMVPAREYELNNNVDYSKPNKVAPTYTGFLVEFFRSSTQLPLDHPIFQKHGNIITDMLGDGSVSYMLGNYRNKSDAEKFMKHIISKQYTNSKIISYRSGSRS